MEETFRQFYNHTIYPELYRMERRRRRLLSAIAGFVVLSLFLIAGGYLIGGNAFALLLAIPAILAGFFISWRLHRFVRSFKPRIVRLILDYIDNQLSYSKLEFYPEKPSFEKDSKKESASKEKKKKEKLPTPPLKPVYLEEPEDKLPTIDWVPEQETEEKSVLQKPIDRKVFAKSGLFITKADNFSSEDYIFGTIGDVAFQMCEVNVSEMAGPQPGPRKVFSGFFCITEFSRPVRGGLFVVPKDQRGNMSRAIKKFNLRGAEEITVEDGLSENFHEHFKVYRTLDAAVSIQVSEAFCESISNYYQQTGQKPIILISGKGAAIGLPSDKDMLEPKIIKSNLSYRQIEEFYRDLRMLFKLIEEIDKMF